jgi:hypothetical protein
MQEPVSISDLFQQINSLRNEMEVAKQSNQEEANEYENDLLEIEQLKEKEARLRVKNEAKLKKGMEVDVQLQTKRTLVSFTRQVFCLYQKLTRYDFSRYTSYPTPYLPLPPIPEITCYDTNRYISV